MAHNHTNSRGPARDVPKELRQFITVREACEIARCCRRTMGRWVSDGYFVTTRPVASGSGKRLIDRASFLAFLLGAEAVA